MILKLKDDCLGIIRADLGKKYLKSGRRLAGSVEDNKIKLYTEDDYGKHSSFMTRVFVGNVSGNRLEGGFRLSAFVIALLAVLFAVCVESIVVAAITAQLSSLVFPIVVIAAELAYLFAIKNISKENDTLILKYLEELKSEDTYTR